MSQYGSFATELIPCEACYKAVARILWDVSMDRLTYQGVRILPGVAGQFIGSVTAAHAGGEIHFFWTEVISSLEDVLCHPLRLVVFAENGDNVVYSLLPIAHLQGPPAPLVETPPAMLESRPPPDRFGLRPGESMDIPVGFLGDTLNVTRIVAGIGEVSYRIPLFIDAEGKLVTEYHTTKVPIQASEIAGSRPAPGGNNGY